MRARLAVLADAANKTADGKLNLLGEFNVLWAATFPVTYPSMFLVVKLEAEPGEGAVPERRLRLRIVDADGNLVAPIVEGRATFGTKFRPDIPLSVTLILQIRGAVFPKRGTYEFEMLIDEETVARVPLHVFPSEERQQPPSA